MIGRISLLAAGLLAGCAAPEPGIAIVVGITGALTRDGTYAHAADDRHGCRELRVYGAPGDGGPLHLTVWEIRFAPDAVPPEASFLLSFDRAGRERQMAVAMTAGGRIWQAVGSMAGFRAELRPSEDLLTGRFRLDGLAPMDGGPERISVIGAWRCPPEQPSP